MTTQDELRRLGLFDARVPRYTSYPPANHFSGAVGPEQTAAWIASVPTDRPISLYIHIPYCRRLCWFCACRTQGTTTDRPLLPYLDQIRQELALVSQVLPPEVTIGRIHLGGGTPTLLSPGMIRALGAEIQALRPIVPEAEFSVEIDPTEIDAARVDALVEIGMNRASIGVQDFDSTVQEAIGRDQSFGATKTAVDLLRAAGVGSVNMDILYGLPHQSLERITASVLKVLSLSPDRVALYGYAHVPWMAKRQVMIPADSLPGPEERLNLFEAARALFLWDGYREIGIDHFARVDDGLAVAAATGRLRRNFQGYTDDQSPVLIGIGASAISRFPQGYAQNLSTSSRYATAIAEGRLATERGHVFSDVDLLRADIIERLMCDFRLDTGALAARHGAAAKTELERITAEIAARFGSEVHLQDGVLTLGENARLIARLCAQMADKYTLPEGRHSRAM